jgi:hypothetical protein
MQPAFGQETAGEDSEGVIEFCSREECRPIFWLGGRGKFVIDARAPPASWPEKARRHELRLE